MISFFKELRKQFGGGSETVNLQPPDRLRLSGKALRILGQETSFVVEMGKQTLLVRPGETLSIDHRHENQKIVFSRPKHAFRRHLQCIR